MNMSNETKFKYQHSELLDLLLKFKNEGLINQEQKIKIKGRLLLLFTFIFLISPILTY